MLDCWGANRFGNSACSHLFEALVHITLPGQPFSSLDLNSFSERYTTVHFDSRGINVLKASVDQFYIDGVLISQVPELRVESIIAAAVFLSLAFSRYKSDQRAS